MNRTRQPKNHVSGVSTANEPIRATTGALRAAHRLASA